MYYEKNDPIIIPTMKVAVNIFIIKDDSLLLIKAEKPTETFYMTVGGKIEHGELCTQTAVREAFEEVGITIREKDLVFAHVVSLTRNAESAIAFFFHATAWKGEPFNKEPGEHTHVGWHKLNALPENVRAHHLQALKLWQQGINYSEHRLVIPVLSS
jgi:8-oxo-dGTP diphosphatase